MGAEGLGWLRWTLRAEWFLVNPDHLACAQGAGKRQESWVFLMFLFVGWPERGHVGRSTSWLSCGALSHQQGRVAAGQTSSSQCLQPAPGRPAFLFPPFPTDCFHLRASHLALKTRQTGLCGERRDLRRGRLCLGPLLAGDGDTHLATPVS